MSAEFDKHAATYDGGLDHPLKRLLGSSADDFIAVKARWLLRREHGLRSANTNGGRLRLLDYGCGAGDLMRVLAGLGARASYAGCDVSTGMLAQAAARWPANLGAVPTLAAQHGARTPFGDGQFDVAIASAVLHHVPPADRPAVYTELGRVLKPGGRLYVFEHNPRNPIVRHVVARTPIDENAILLDLREVQDGLLGSGRYEIETDFLMFTPPSLAWLGFVDRALAWLPLGAQYAVAARKPA
ncbi:MAG: class I SAM-dependent methyltransferase [Enhydrobacter sp.]|nr:class I SAM-dependent methyltransferase [Enhydrobacter sp.]